MSLRFGTDGVRGDTRTVLTSTAVAALGRAAAETLGGNQIVVGRDTRVSGRELALAMHAGVSRGGASSVDLGVITTPAVARWCADQQVVGAVVSASHNPWHDNGVKFFTTAGLKLSESSQHQVASRFEHYLANADEPGRAAVASPENSPNVTSKSAQALDNHFRALVDSVAGRNFGGIKVVADLANGAATTIAARTLTALGTNLTLIHDNADGYNINAACGSTNLASLTEAVLTNRADIGLAFDGDADRVLAVDASGKLVDGDEIIAICALDLQKQAKLAHNTVAITTMTNLGFRQAMHRHGIALVETAVGDRYVLEALDAKGLNLGGEQSGHVIFRDLATTGDGLLTAIQLIDIMVRRESSLASLAQQAMTRLPQVLCNVAIPKLLSQSEAENLHQKCLPLLEAATTRLAGTGRILLRASGTEPLIRVMVEAETVAEAQMEADAFADVVTRNIANLFGSQRYDQR